MRRARRSPTARFSTGTSAVVFAVAGEGWTLKTNRKKRSRVQAPLPASTVRQDLPAELAGLCFNCLAGDHVAAFCPNPTKCLHCKGEGHVTRACKARRTPSRSPPASAAAVRGAPPLGPALIRGGQRPGSALLVRQGPAAPIPVVVVAAPVVGAAAPPPAAVVAAVLAPVAVPPAGGARGSSPAAGCGFSVPLSGDLHHSEDGGGG
ncbi:actin cytoskeleton-regulatory complex protein PAN1-like [Brachypodium distachyon]|uniref:actin cytoskeleton-regulatory complex protein PAN1-like n=1 Tax=Brachypodium distachyon TaxID=15368 RepID=UPI00071E4C25|nr:actin cytoskeleton-regulatory complex protein PAN1-like [Brachypodium distachyon]|eukprot:XP_014754119.1 actin cytoskeleton-regulatory complex protein PAN1-like [Brachypodium distachyon]